jgi:hypothetical protein
MLFLPYSSLERTLSKVGYPHVDHGCLFDVIIIIRTINLLSGNNLINLSDSDPDTFHECKYNITIGKFVRTPQRI